MVFKKMLEYERSMRGLAEELKDKPKGYFTELKINGYNFSTMKSPHIEIILLDSNQRQVAYRPKPGNGCADNNEGWFFGDYQKALEDAFSWINQEGTYNDQRDNFKKPAEDKSPEYTLMGFF